MTLNQYMHPRNIYRVPPIFKELAEKYPDLRKYVVSDLGGKVRLDFKDPDALRALTTTLLIKDFELEVTIPRDRLVPTLPLRLNYILWIEDLLSTVHIDRISSEVLGLDIGTGATCVYPLLGCRKNGWRFLATDSDDEALEVAKQNVAANQLQEKIKCVIRATEDSILTRTVLEANRSIDFSMCNPPFFKDDVEANSLTKRRKLSRPPPHATNHPQLNESITEGGELAFVAKMIEESAKLQGKIRIYTTMFGKKSSVAEATRLIAEVVGKAGGRLVTTEFCQGRTMRWGVAWTFLADIRIDAIAPTKKPKEKPAHPVGFTVPTQINCCHYSVLSIREKVEEILADIKMTPTKLKTADNLCALHFTALSNTWSHQRRRRRELKQQQQSKMVKLENGEPVDAAKTGKDDRRIETAALASTSEPVVEGMLFIRKVSADGIVLQVQWIGGSLGKDAAHQIIQFLKNKMR